MFNWLIPGAHRQSRFDFKDKTVLITGASGGLGEGIARELYKRGARLILAARSVDKLKELCETLKRSGPGHEPVYAFLDLAAPEYVEDLVKLSHNGKIDCLVNNAGISNRGSVIETDLSITITRALLPFIPDDGAIVVISSGIGKAALPYRSAYAASKHALQAFFDSLRTEERFGLHMMVVSAGYIATDLGNNALDGGGRPTGVTGPETANGYTPEEAAKRIADATERREADFVLAQFVPRIAFFLRRVIIIEQKSEKYWWPNLYFYSVWQRQKAMTEASKKN